MTATIPKTLLQAEADFLATGLELQAQALSLLLAEMQALTAVMPGAVPAAERKDDTTTEADFDNMPV